MTVINPPPVDSNLGHVLVFHGMLAVCHPELGNNVTSKHTLFRLRALWLVCCMYVIASQSADMTVCPHL